MKKNFFEQLKIQDYITKVILYSFGFVLGYYSVVPDYNLLFLISFECIFISRLYLLEQF